MDAVAWVGAYVKFLILGASSFYGTNFAECVRKHGDEAVCLSRPQWNLSEPIQYAECVVNFASSSMVALSWGDPEAWLGVNALHTTTLLNQVRALKVPRFVHVSTPEVYGNTPMPVREGAPFNPSTPYAVSRAAADMMIQAYHRAYGFPAIITRTANIYGVGQPDYRFIPHAFKTLRAGEKLALDGGGKTIRGWIHVRDACEATYLLCKEGLLGHTYHIAPESILTVRALAGLICGRLGLDETALVDRPDRLGKDDAYIMDSSKIRRLGWTDRIDINEGLDEYMRAQS